MKQIPEVVRMLNETVKCTIAPSKYGVGVFAIRDIKQGEILTEYTYESGNLNKEKEFIYLNREDFAMIDEEVKSLILDRSLFEKGNSILAFLHPNEDAFLVTFMNHSSNPNSDTSVALRDIKKGEEITFDYHQSRIHRFDGVSNLFDPLTLEHMPFLK